MPAKVHPLTVSGKYRREKTERREAAKPKKKWTMKGKDGKPKRISFYHWCELRYNSWIELFEDVLENYKAGDILSQENHKHLETLRYVIRIKIKIMKKYVKKVRDSMQPPWTGMEDDERLDELLYKKSDPYNDNDRSTRDQLDHLAEVLGHLNIIHDSQKTFKEMNKKPAQEEKAAQEEKGEIQEAAPEEKGEMETDNQATPDDDAASIADNEAGEVEEDAEEVMELAEKEGIEDADTEEKRDEILKESMEEWLQSKRDKGAPFPQDKKTQAYKKELMYWLKNNKPSAMLSRVVQAKIFKLHMQLKAGEKVGKPVSKPAATIASGTAATLAALRKSLPV